MSMREWYKYLLEENVTMRDIDEEGRRELVPCRIELAHRNTSWDESYRLSRLRGLTPAEKSLLFCIIHELLPSNYRLNRVNPATNPSCSLCNSGEDETYPHIFITCSANSEAMGSLLQCIRSYSDNDDEENYLRLNIGADDPFSLPTVILLAKGCGLVWSNRKLRKETSKYEMRAELEARVQLLRKCRSSRLREAGDIITNMIENFFR